MWTRFDDSFYDHPKVEKAGNAAIGALVKMTTWCSRHYTNGRVPFSKALAFAETDEKLLERLLKVGFLEEKEDGYQIHDYERYNPDTREKKKIRSDQATKAVKARWAKAGK